MKLANERREKPRINVTGTAFVFDRGGRQQVSLRNLSAVGLLVEIPRPPKLKEAVRIGLCLDGKSWLELHGVVRRVSKRRGGSECAIDLRPSNLELRLAIDTYVQQVATAMTVAKQRDMFKARLAGVGTAKPATTSRDELIKRVLPGVVLPPEGVARTPPGGVSAADVLAAKQVAVASAGGTAKPVPAEPPRRSTQPPQQQQSDPKMRALFKAAIKDLNSK